MARVSRPAPRAKHPVQTALPIDETVHAVSADCYATTKAQCEDWCKRYVDWYGKPATTLRPAHIIGAQQLEAFTAMDHTRPEPHLHDYIGVWDVAAAVEHALQYDPPNGFEAFLINADDQYTKVPSVELVHRLFPGVAHVVQDKLGACDGFGALVDCGKAKKHLGWRPSYRCRR